MSNNFHLTLRVNSLFVSGGAVIRLVVSLISIPLLVRFLGIERYGVWVVLNSVIAIAGLMELGLSTAFTNYLSIDYTRKDWFSGNQTVVTSFIIITCIGIFTSVGLWSVSPLIGRALFLEETRRMEALLALGVMSWLLLLRFWQQWEMAAEAALLRYDVQSVIETASTIIMQIGIMFLALSGGSLRILAVWSIAVTCGSILLHWLALKHLFSGHFNQFLFSVRTATDLVGFGSAHWLSSLGSSLFGYADRIIVNFLLGSATAGLYSAVTSIAVQINALSAIPLRVLPPTISTANALSQSPWIRQIFIRATRLNGLIVLIIMIPLLVGAPYISSFLIGPEDVDLTAEVLRIMVFAYGLYSLSAAGFFSAIGIGIPMLNARWGIISALFSLFLLAYLASRIGLMGAAWGNIGYAIVLMINFQLIKVIGLDFRTYIKNFFPSLSMVLLWSLGSIYLKFEGLPIWALILIIICVTVPSLVFVSGITLLKDTMVMTLNVFKTSITTMRSLVSGSK